MTSVVTMIPTTRWERVFQPATDSASAAIGLWTGGNMVLSLDEVREVSLAELSESLPPGEDPSTMVIVGISGSLSGQLILIFDDDSARQMAACLLQRECAGSEEWTALEWSALSETGNIFASAYLNAMGACIGEAVFLPSAPTVLRDYAAGLMEQAVMAQALDGDSVLFCRTCMARSGTPINFTALFVPSQELLEVLRSSVHSCVSR